MSLDDLKLRIKNDLPISSIIGNYLVLEKSGSAWISLCPFHSDSKPSMHINDSKKMFRCFACDAAGDSIQFVMQFRNLGLVEAIEEIIEKNGIDLKSDQVMTKANPKEINQSKVIQDFEESIENSIRDFNFFCEKIISEKIPDGVDSKLALLKRAFDILSPFGTRLEATERISIFANDIGLKSDSRQIIKAYEQYLAAKYEISGKL